MLYHEFFPSPNSSISARANGAERAIQTPRPARVFLPIRRERQIFKRALTPITPSSPTFRSRSS